MNERVGVGARLHAAALPACYTRPPSLPPPLPHNLPVVCSAVCTRSLCTWRRCNTVRHHFNEDVITAVSAPESATRPRRATTHRLALLAALLTQDSCTRYLQASSGQVCRRGTRRSNEAYSQVKRGEERCGGGRTGQERERGEVRGAEQEIE